MKNIIHGHLHSRIHLSQETIIECKQSAENDNLFELPINEKEDDENIH